MKLSDKTVSVLKNYSTINQNLMIKVGNTLSTMSAMKNIVAKATVSETFEKDVAIYDLNEFLAALSLFENPDLDFQDKFVIMKDKTNNVLKYWYSDPSVVTAVKDEINMPPAEISFNLSDKVLSDITKAAAVIGVPDMVLHNGTLRVTDKKNDTANMFSMEVDYDKMDHETPIPVDHKFWFKVENLKLMPGTYNVGVSKNKISNFKNTQVDIEYFIALEPESYYGK
tara:strand:- start:1737 stop:2414 length:678 start_codon:yes stop_codon:yes gene_type:complete